MALGGGRGDAASFLPALGALVLLGGWLTQQTRQAGADAALALLLLVPAVGTRLWGQLNAEIHVPRLRPEPALAMMLGFAGQALSGVAGHLAGAGVGQLVLGHRWLAAPALLAAAAVVINTAGLHVAQGALASGDWSWAATATAVAGWAPLLLAPLLLAARGPLRTGGLWIALVLCAGSLAISPLRRFVSLLPHPTDAALPVGPPGRPVLGAVVRGPDWGASMDAAGLRRFRAQPGRWCEPVAAWDSQLRLWVRAALPPDEVVGALRPLFRELYDREVSLLALQGAAEAGLPGPVGAVLDAPSVTFALDAAPEEISRGLLQRGGALVWHTAPQGGQCVLRAEDGVAVQALYDAGRALQAPGGACARRLGLDVRSVLPACP